MINEESDKNEIIWSLSNSTETKAVSQTTSYEFDINSLNFFNQIENPEFCLFFLKALQSYPKYKLDQISSNENIIKLFSNLIISNIEEISYNSLKVLRSILDRNNINAFLVCFPLSGFFNLIFTDSKNALISVNIFSKIISLISPYGADEVIQYYEISKQHNNEFYIYSAYRIIANYLCPLNSFPNFLRKINLFHDVNYLILQLNKPKFIYISLEVINLCITKCNVSYQFFNVNQILRLMRAKNDRKIQKNSLKVVKSILLRLDSDFLFNPQLYKSLSYTLLHSSFDVQVLSLECLKLIFDYADQQIENILMQMMNEEIVETIFELIGLSDDASILSTSILLTLIRRCPNSPCSCFVQQKLCDPSLYNQIEEITLSENSIVATHASMLLKYVPFEE